jgi:O-antigen/teichoic acid export membrane protein
MRFTKRLRNSKAGRNFGASIFSFISRMAFGLLSIPIAVHYLTKEELGLWTTVNVMVGYLMWMDMGVGNATGRKIADAVVAKDPLQINIWWTATQMSLWALGGLTMILGLCLSPVFSLLFKIPDSLTHDAWVLFVGMILCSAVNFPLRGVPGLLTAQERFHWVPIAQGLAPWIQLVVFFLMLRDGHGLNAYIYGTAASQTFAFVFYRILIATSPIRPRYVRKGVTKAHFKELFGFSLNIAFIGFKETFLGSLPVLILARMSGLQYIPIYNISGRVSGMFRSLSTRVNHSFLPELINLHVAEKHQTFFVKYRRSLLLTTSISLFGAGVVMLVNRSIVTILAGPEFYAGDLVTAWFSLFLVVVTISSVFQALLQISGDMGKSIPFSIVTMVVMLVAAPVGFKFFGMAGLAAVFAFQPILYGVYGLVRGARNCHYELKEFMNLGMVASVISIAAVIVIGCFMDSSHPLGDSILLFGKAVLLPSLSQIVCSAILFGIAGVFGWLGLQGSKSKLSLKERHEAVSAS